MAQRLLYRLGSVRVRASLSSSGCALKLTLLTVGLSNLRTIDTELAVSYTYFSFFVDDVSVTKSCRTSPQQAANAMRGVANKVRYYVREYGGDSLSEAEVANSSHRRRLRYYSIISIVGGADNGFHPRIQYNSLFVRSNDKLITARVLYSA